MVREGSIDELIALAEQIPEFKDLYPKEEFEKRLLQNNSSILIAEEEGFSVGFKCGYPLNTNEYYSWMGGVMPRYRNQGIALLLLREMENRIKSKEYKYLSFKTLNEHKAMLIFALKNGFEIIEVVSSSKDSKPRIWLKKQLR